MSSTGLELDLRRDVGGRGIGRTTPYLNSTALFIVWFASRNGESARLKSSRKGTRQPRNAGSSASSGTNVDKPSKRSSDASLASGFPAVPVS